MRHWRVGATLLASLAVAGVCEAGGLSEVRLGVLAHDPLINKEDGVDLNAELYFDSWTEGSWELRPSIGGTLALEEDATSFAYLDLNYGGPLFDSVFAEFSFGGAIHDGKLDSTDPNRKELGSRVLFHAAASIGIMVGETTSISLYVDHISNAGIEEHNEGLETAGIRIGFRL
jgi:lipid A 3-O-deacylase